MVVNLVSLYHFQETMLSSARTGKPTRSVSSDIRDSRRWTRSWLVLSFLRPSLSQFTYVVSFLSSLPSPSTPGQAKAALTLFWSPFIVHRARSNSSTTKSGERLDRELEFGSWLRVLLTRLRLEEWVGYLFPEA